MCGSSTTRPMKNSGEKDSLLPSPIFLERAFPINKDQKTEAGPPHQPQAARQSSRDNQPGWLEGKLGPYRSGDRHELHQGGSAAQVIFNERSSAPDKAYHFASGATIPDHGSMGSLTSLKIMRGAVRLVVYGDPKTGKPSSWELYEWKGSGKKQPDTQIEINQWQKVPTYNEAINKPGLIEALRAFEAKKHAVPIESK